MLFLNSCSIPCVIFFDAASNSLPRMVPVQDIHFAHDFVQKSLY